jgi:hypothetical protein
MASNSAWVGGINNRANAKSVPDGFVRDLVNLDPLVGGELGLRAGYDLRAPAANARGALSVGNSIIFADGPALICFDSQSNTAHTLAQIADGGRLVGAVLNQELFFCTANESFRFDGSTLRQWGVPTVVDQPLPNLTAGSLLTGTYQVAMTLMNAQGEEGATVNPVHISVSDGAGFALYVPALPAGYTARLYVSPPNAETLYLQYEGVDPYVVTMVRDDTARCENLNLRAPGGGDQIASLGSVLLIADGKTLWHTLAMSPHLIDQSNNFFQYPSDISVVLQVDGGVFVCADKTYFLQSPESGDVVQGKKLEFGAVPGTGSILPDGRATWMTQYGLAVGALDGSVTLLSQNNFVPEMAQSGASGVIDHNGNQMVVTSMRGQQGPNPLAASDYYEAEIVTP